MEPRALHPVQVSQGEGEVERGGLARIGLHLPGGSLGPLNIVVNPPLLLTPRRRLRRDGRYELAAPRYLSRYIEEVKPSLLDFAEVAAVLAERVASR